MVYGQGGPYTSKPYQFLVSSTDPDGDKISYTIDWDNNSTVDATIPEGPSGSSEVFTNSAGLWTVAGDYSFVVKAIDPKGKSASAVFNITITDIPKPSVTLIANPPYLNPGQSSAIRLSWSSENATACTASGDWIGSKSTSGTFNTQVISTSKRYVITCTGNGLSSVSTAVINFPTNVMGWAWSSNIGYISFNSLNSGAGGGTTYAVKIATSTTEGYFTGYAWSSNIGWISFSSGDVSHPTPKVNLQTGQVTGWVRACVGTVNGDCTGVDRTDGWDGWISLSGTNHESPNLDGSRGITFDKITGKFNGYAWGGEVMGWISFNTNISVPVICEGCIDNGTNGGLARCSIDSINPSRLTSLGGNVTISYSSAYVNANSCFITRPPSPSIGTIVSPGTGSIQTNVPSNNSTSQATNFYRMDCTTGSPAVPLSCTGQSVVVDPPNTNTVDSPEMWLDGDVNKKQTSIRKGNNAIVNWDIKENTNCFGVNVKSNSSLRDTSWYNSGTFSSILGLGKGQYVLKISCDNTQSNTVEINVKDSITGER